MGTARIDSDWDFLIITPVEVPSQDQRKVLSRIRKKFIFDYNVEADMLVLSQSQAKAGSDDKGRISYYAQRDGVLV